MFTDPNIPVTETKIPLPADATTDFEIETSIKELRETFNSGKTFSYEFRLRQLKNLQKLLKNHEEDFAYALHQDLRKPRLEARGELIAVDVDLTEAINKLYKWMSREELPYNLLFPADKAFIMPEPYGVVLIIGAWNYPMILTLQPLIGAIAAGNCVIIKPSELSPSSSMKLAELLPKYLDMECYKVIQGGIQETTSILNQRLDYIFSTSSTRVGKHIMQVAAKNLTPVTLELGGKCAVYVHDSADLTLSVKRILWGKMTNNGQTCLAPDYVICSRKVRDYFVTRAASFLQEWYGSNMKASPDIGRIINKTHYNRLKSLLIETKGDILYGGEHDSSDLWISPTFVGNLQENDVLLQEEIFGPLLPFVEINSALEAVQYLKHKVSKPLALYVFSRDKSVEKLFLQNTSSGAVVLNDVMLHAGWHGLPFGGVQDSGMGTYHGRYSFECFSHRKSVLSRNFSVITEKASGLRYPPYKNTDWKLKIVSAALKNYTRFDMPRCNFSLSHVLVFILGMLTVVLFSVIFVEYKESFE